MVLFVFLFSLVHCAFSWTRDRFLDGYEETTIVMPDDYSGKVVCTLVRKTAKCESDFGVLYVHGYNDYFFNAEMGEIFADSCYNFYAVDLRKYGRSLTAGQEPYQCRKVSEYFPDIDSAVVRMAAEGIDKIILMGHSTGGLIVASYMNDRPESEINAVILNSPFLDWNMSGFVRKIGIPVVTWIGGWWPGLKISQGKSTAYAESLLKDYHGEWQYDTNLKTIYPRKVSAGWVRAITKAQEALRKQSDIKCPVLLMRSDKSVYGDSWNEDFQHGDGVLNVEHISEYGLKLGPDVTEDVVAGGLHDLALSEHSIRAKFYADIFRWLDSLHLRPECTK